MDEKIQPKFVLPSPKFDKPNAPSTASHHYLTPSGMTLLPRAKQPPPMYGARGSTVPAKYLANETNHHSDVPAAPPVYKSPPRPEYCHTCGMMLANSQDMKLHLDKHEACPAGDCDFAALHNILEQHIEANHITGDYKKVKKVWTEVELAAWRAERRKRFPTAANVEQARLAKEQRMKRGERLEASKSRFGNHEDRQRTRPKSDHKDRVKPNKKKKRRGQRKPNEGKRREGTSNEVKEAEATATAEKKSIEEGAKDKQTNLFSGKFQGTGQMKDYKHFKDKIAKKDNALIGLLGMYGSDSEEESGTESEEMEEDIDEEAEDLKTPTECVQNESPDLEKSESSREIINKENTISPAIQNASNSGDISTPPASSSVNFTSKVQNEPEATSPAKEHNSSSDEAPDEEPFQRVTETIIQEDPPKPEPKEVPRPQLAPKRAAPKRVYGLNFKKARKTTQQNTLLSKLLESDIRHERNVLLQCVRHVCERNFFGIGQSKEPTKSDAAEAQMVPSCDKPEDKTSDL
ncbi:FMR1-interacting protein NUFIP1 [Drosophila kikkawai]|uniref:FMR1-interacting protein NUFIP1 n=1 Tax=Drosophila kikkawai TaxID=30033 RepID=A0A6P4JSG2_DROKI|nr:nuclear fragile X mental retardation-interacting protein 1 [Drosophila kikkawai]